MGGEKSTKSVLRISVAPMSAGPFAAVAAVAAALLMSVTARAGEFVQFRSGDALLTGYTARPAGSGPFPAVVLLHGCGGYHASMMSWTDRLAASGYVALSVDSFGSRGIAVNCGGFAQQPADAFAALEFLAGKQFVRADAVAVMGFSMGGNSTLAAVEQESIGRLHARKFRAGVAFYPNCSGSTGVMTVPTLVLIGRADDWTPASDCEDMAAGRSAPGLSRRPGDRSRLRLVVYPNARHGFDVADLMYPKEYRLLGHLLAYDDGATRDAIGQVRTFLQEQLKN
jgi:dienelactone hydrolase